MARFLVLLLAAYGALGHFFHKDHSHLPSRLARPASSGISDEEIEFQNDRIHHTYSALEEYFFRVGVEFDPAEYADSVIGLAFSGGGYRAMLTGAGELSALDSRTQGSLEPGHLGGLLQASSYTVGLSGGGWLLGSVYFRNFSTIADLVAQPDIWDLDQPFFSANTEPTLMARVTLYWRLLQNVMWKKANGYSVTITDIWGRFLYRQLIAGSEADSMLDENPRFWRWSDLRYEPWYLDRTAPFPIITVISRVPVYLQPHQKSPILEINPLEIGSFDPDPNAFVDIEYLGVKMTNGRPDLSNPVIVGLDEAGFLLGASSSLFDQLFTGIIEMITTSKTLAKATRFVLQHTGIMELRDVAAISPNPFWRLSSKKKAKFTKICSSKTLYVADGGSNGQVIPIQPLLEPSREVDVIFAFDNSGSELDIAWPDGQHMVNSFERQFQVLGSPPMPFVPDRETFLNLGLNRRPTFFGCYASNQTGLAGDTSPPVVVYIPNVGYSDFSNTSTFQLAYTDQKINSMISNGYNIMTQGNGTVDPEWAACVACAISQRARERKGHELGDQCQRCFDRYCWAGDVDTDYDRAQEELLKDRELLL